MVALVDSRSQDMFDIDPNTGTISTNIKLDREFMDVHYLRIVATTNDSPQLTATTTVQVLVFTIFTYPSLVYCMFQINILFV